MPPSPTFRSFVGVAKEVTKGTHVAATDYIKVGGFSPQDVPTRLADQAWQGSAVDEYGSQHGQRHSEITVEESPLYVDTFGWFMKGVFGEEALSGTSPYTHAFTLLNSGDTQPPALSFTDQVGSIQAKGWPGVQIVEVTLTIDPDGNVTYTASGQGFPPTNVASPVAAFSAVKPMQGWRMSATLNGTAIHPFDLSINFIREIEVKTTASGSQNPNAVWVGRLGVSIEGEILAENDSHPAALAADTQGIFNLTGTRGTGATTETLTVLCSQTAYEAVEYGRGQSEVHYGLTLKALGNTTDVGTSAGKGPAKVTLVNARSTVY